MRSRPIRDDSSVSCNDGTGDDECYSSYTSTCTYKTCVGVCQASVNRFRGRPPHLFTFCREGNGSNCQDVVVPVNEECPYCRHWGAFIPRDFPSMFQNRLVQFNVDSTTPWQSPC